MKFRKPALSIPDLVQRWKDRGLGVPDPAEAEHYLSFIGYLRNLCAHYSRLWNRQFVIKPMIATRHAKFLKSNDRCYAMAVVVEDLLRTVAPGTTWGARLHELLVGHPFIDPAAMGFPPGWDAEPFWNLPPSP